MFEKIQPQKAYMYIIEQIIDLVEVEKLKPGDKLPSESVLTSDFGASRSTVRQALSALEALGVIVGKGGKGNFIQDHLNFDYLRYRSRELGRVVGPEELLECRKLLEADIAEVAAEKAEKEDIISIEKNVKRFKSIIERSSNRTDYNRLGKIDREFHSLIAKATHNAAFAHMMRYIIRGLKGETWISMKEKSWGVHGRSQKYLLEHEGILNAIRDHNPKEARKRMYSHITGIEEDLFVELAP